MSFVLKHVKNKEKVLFYFFHFLNTKISKVLFACYQFCGVDAAGRRIVAVREAGGARELPAAHADRALAEVDVQHRRDLVVELAEALADLLEMKGGHSRLSFSLRAKGST